MKKIGKIGKIVIALIVTIICMQHVLWAYDYQGKVESFDPEGGATTEQIVDFLEEICVEWCNENKVTVRDIEDINDPTGGRFYLNDKEIEINEIIDKVKEQVPRKEQIKIDVLVDQSKALDSAFNNFQLRGRVVKKLSEQQNVDITIKDPNNGVVKDPNDTEADIPETNGSSIADIITGALDGLFGILLYPIKLLILAAGGIFNLIIQGIASIGGASDGLVSVEDIIYTTSTTLSGREQGVPIVSINFFENKDATNEIIAIREGIAGWYYAFRNLSIVISLCVLIYTGIRMATSSIAEDKARYKTMLVNWVVQMVLIFLLQYIIFFTILANNAVVNALSRSGGDQNSGVVDYMKRLFDLSFSPTITKGFGAAAIYLILLGITFAFLIMYIKRMITIGFLIAMAPLVTVTYAIDKVGDSRSQALNTWLKEFVYNVLIQPFHCLIFSVFVTTALGILTTADAGNFGAPILAIVCMMFMFKAEDLLRKIFAFNKNAQSLGSGLGTAAALGAGIGTVSNMLNKDKGSGKRGSNPNNDISDIAKLNTSLKTGGMQSEKNMQAAESAGGTANVPGGRAKTASEVEKSRSQNRAKAKKNAAGGMVGMAAGVLKAEVKAAIPVATALIGAGQGDATKMIASLGAGIGIEKGIENVINGSKERQNKAIAEENRKSFPQIYKEYEEKLMRQGGRWEKLSKAERVEDTRRLLRINDIQGLVDEDERNLAVVVRAMRDSYGIEGYNDPEGSLMERIRRIE